MRKTDPVSTISFPSQPWKRGKVKVKTFCFCRSLKKKKLFSSRWKENNHCAERTRQVLLSSSFLKHPQVPSFPPPLPNSSKCPPLQLFPFSAFRAAAVNMRSTPDTNQPPLIITAATKQENKYGREERRDEGWMRGSLCRVSGAIKRLDAAWNNKNRVLEEVGWGQTVLLSRTETLKSVSDWFLMGRTEPSSNKREF